MSDAARRTFDRTTDVPKIIGCTTRNVEYRWSVFEAFLADIPSGSAVLDFGAGSLRETYELSRRGFQVTAIDLNEETLRSYEADYDWSSVAHSPHIIAGSLDELGEQNFSLITAFDVFEHMERPEELLAQMHGLLREGGLIFCTVPNRRSAYEIAFRIHWKIGLAMGRHFTPGEPHIQFKSPHEWDKFFTSGTGFRIKDHQMAIGAFVNTWSALTQIPQLLVRRILGRSGKEKSHGGLFTSMRVMRALHRIDQSTAPVLQSLCAWNLIVLQKAPTN